MELKDFLVEAKINTYAKDGEGGERVLEDGSKELIYENKEWKYRDRYFGFNPFIGEEAVWENGKMIWGMNYYGKILSDKVDVSQVYQFLKKAMRLVEADRPFRGPTELQEEEWDYRDENNGNIDKFEGVETIYFQKEKVYELKYHGGVIKEAK
ncbi:MAG: DUF5680 domain-containing protein [Candidatus Paceibacterota bacterium]